MQKVAAYDDLGVREQYVLERIRATLEHPMNTKRQQLDRTIKMCSALTTLRAAEIRFERAMSEAEFETP